LLGAFAAGVYYIGTDVDPETVAGNKALAERLGFDASEVHEAPAEIFDPGLIDLVFTSPPYFNRELYLGERQSWKSYPTFEGWEESFLLPVIQRAFERLPIGGHLVLNVADVRHGRRTYPVVDSVLRIADRVGFQPQDRLWMSIERAREPLLVFSK
jgi:DNA modification methylase